jgi:hypothetical protein
MATKKINRRVKKVSPSTLSPFSKYVNVRVSGAGDFLDVRFRVTEHCLEPGPVYLKDEATGKYMTVATAPRVGSLMTRRVQAGNNGFLLLHNPDSLIKTGSLVTLGIGRFIQEHIKVE